MSGALEHLFARYVSGNVSLPTATLIEAHLSLSDANNQFVDALETLAGASLEETAPCAVRNEATMLDRIFSSTGADLPNVERIRAGKPAQGDVPEVLKSYLQMDLQDVPWRKLMPGFWEYDLDDNGQHVSLIKVKAGHKLPKHTHEGQELTLVLKGSFSDASGEYKVGDIAIADESVDHQPVVGADEDCICFVVVDAPVKLTGPIGRLISPFIRH